MGMETPQHCLRTPSPSKSGNPPQRPPPHLMGLQLKEREANGQCGKRLQKPVGDGWESGWGAGGGGYKAVAAAAGIGRMRLEHN